VYDVLIFPLSDNRALALDAHHPHAGGARQGPFLARVRGGKLAR
jgi:hypothetical protein